MEELSADDVCAKHGLIKFMSLQEICAYASASERYIKLEIKRKNLKAYKPVRELKFDPKDVEAWIKRKLQTA